MKKLILISIAIILLLPLMFTGPRDEQNLVAYLLKCTLPAMMVVVFWVNYLYILPRHAQHGSIVRVTIENAILLLACSAILAVAHVKEASLHGPNHHQRPPVHIPARSLTVSPKPRPHHKTAHFVVFVGLRDAVYLMLVIFVAYSVLASRKMEHLQREHQEAELARQKAELRGLRNQVSPHFLLNTLNNIYALSLTNNSATSDAVMRLSELLRHTLYDSQTEFVTLSSEVQFINAYVELMRMRLAPNVKVTTDLRIAPDSTTQVAPLLFISLLENAFKHGVSPRQNCHISITLYEDQEIHFRTVNSYYPKGENDRSGHGIGLELTQKRLSLYYPNRHHWTKGRTGDEWISDLTIQP